MLYGQPSALQRTAQLPAPTAKPQAPSPGHTYTPVAGATVAPSTYHVTRTTYHQVGTTCYCNPNSCSTNPRTGPRCPRNQPPFAIGSRLERFEACRPMPAPGRPPAAAWARIATTGARLSSNRKPAARLALELEQTALATPQGPKRRKPETVTPTRDPQAE